MITIRNIYEIKVGDKKAKYGGKTLTEWGKQLGVSKQRVHQIIKKYGFSEFKTKIESGHSFNIGKLTLAMQKQRKPWNIIYD